MNHTSWLHSASENSARQLSQGCLVVLAMGAGAKIVCAAFLRGTITLVQYAAYFGCSFLPVMGEGEFAGVSFDSDYSGEGDASFLLFFEVRCCLSA
jgi:hypothetical protein